MKMRTKGIIGEVAFDYGNKLFLVTLTLLFLYPMWHVVMASFSEADKLIAQIGPVIKPQGFSLKGYHAVFHNKNIITGYANTLFYVSAGTLLNMFMTILGAYTLSRQNLYIKKFLTLFVVVTMYIHAGLIPDFLLVKYLGLYNTRAIILLTGLVNTWNLIVMRTAFSQIPRSLEESAMMDGAGDLTIMFKIILPVSKATVMVIFLFYAVAHWNSWFSAVIYLKDRGKYPIQLFLREILLMNNTADSSIGTDATTSDFFMLGEVIKYCAIVVSTLPVLVIYPLVQKHFVTGVMLGSVKE
jgi:putative aldouronate transport system permease protein